MEKSIKFDQNLLLLARNGDAAATEAILQQLEPLVLRLAGEYHIDSGDEEDLRQEARCGITKAIATYDPTQNDSFIAYAVLCIKSALLSAVRHDTRQKTQVINHAVELTDELGHAVDSAERVVLRRQEISDVNKKIRRALSPKERAVLLLFADGYTYKEIAGALRMSTKAVDNALARARAKLQ